MLLTDKVHGHIIYNYTNIKNFSEITKIPEPIIIDILKNGINLTNAQIFIDICFALNLTAEHLDDGYLRFVGKQYIGKQIRKLRHTSKKTLTDMSNVCDTDPITILLWEIGYLTPSEEYIKLCNIENFEKK